MLKDREILLGVSGSIAAYKAAELTRLLTKAGARVQVIMTKAACEFIAPLTFFSLTNREVYSELFSGGPEVATAHIELARRADLVIVAPATARTIAKIVNGSAEDLLSTAVIAADVPVIIAPAMNLQMYRHQGVQRNLQILQSWENYYIAPPGSGELACGEYGLGRLAEPSEIVEFAEMVLSGGQQDLVGEKIVVTAGPTLEDLDPVRYLTNRSSGKMGFAIAEMAARRGAEVHLITSIRDKALPAGCQPIYVRSAADMAQAVHALEDEATVLIMAAAVADYRPREFSSSKLKKGEGEFLLKLERTEDILAHLKPSSKRITIGFAAETEDLLENAEEKLRRKNLDMIVANDVSEKGSGFGTDTNRVVLLKRDGERLPQPLMSKKRVAHLILDQIHLLRENR